MGIELKGWYVLAREGAPTYRFTVTADACNPQDLLVVVPWALSSVLAGSPVLCTPFIEGARYCAEKRNYYWCHERDAATDPEITIATGVRPYPAKSDRISDRPASDSGKNFRRLARYGIMASYMERMRATEVSGVRVSEWLAVFKRRASEK